MVDGWAAARPSNLCWAISGSEVAFERHTFKCSASPQISQRLVFSRAVAFSAGGDGGSKRQPSDCTLGCPAAPFASDAF
jgi:hypothetical protein